MLATKFKYQPNQEFVQTINGLDPHLEHYTMYVGEANNNCRSDSTTVYNNHDHNNNNIATVGEFYVLPVDDEIISSDGYSMAQKARVRLVGATSGNQLSYRQSQNEINLATNFSNNNNTTADQTKTTDHLLHTDV